MHLAFNFLWENITSQHLFKRLLFPWNIFCVSTHYVEIMISFIVTFMRNDYVFGKLLGFRKCTSLLSNVVERLTKDSSLEQETLQSFSTQLCWFFTGLIEIFEKGRVYKSFSCPLIFVFLLIVIVWKLNFVYRVIIPILIRTISRWLILKISGAFCSKFNYISFK